MASQAVTSGAATGEGGSRRAKVAAGIAPRGVFGLALLLLSPERRPLRLALLLLSLPFRPTFTALAFQDVLPRLVGLALRLALRLPGHIFRVAGDSHPATR